MTSTDVSTEWGLFQAGGDGPSGRSAGRVTHELLPNLEERERALGIRPGQPFLLRGDGSADIDVLLYLNSASFKRLTLTSQVAYASDMRLYLSYLSSQGVDWRDTTEDDLLNYEYWRRYDERNPRRVGGATFARELTACRRFYEWQQERGVIGRSPVEDAQFQPTHRRPVRMKWLTLDAYRQWCEIGLGGYCLDDSYDESWRGRNASRNLAFAETLWSSGLRLREAGTLLFAELPYLESKTYLKGRLGEGVAKGPGRDFWISRRAVFAIESYRKWSRAAAVRRAQEQGRYDDLRDIMIQESITRHRRMIYRDMQGNKGEVPLDSLTVDDRHRVFVEGESGLEPAMVWLSEKGLPMPHTTWQKIFQLANARCASQGLTYVSCNPNMLRHSFALCRLSEFMDTYERRFGHLAPEERGEFHRILWDPFSMVSLMLGHSSRETTEKKYRTPLRQFQHVLALSEPAKTTPTNGQVS